MVNKIKYLASLPAPVGCVAALAKGMALGGALRLATNAGRLAEQDNITLKEHYTAQTYRRRLNDLLRDADDALYAAKRGGRNRVVMADNES